MPRSPQFLKQQKHRERRKSNGICARCQGKVSTLGQTRCVECQKWHKQYSIEHRKKLREKCYDHYGRVCQCCKILFNEAFLTLGHVNQDGAAHRRQDKVAKSSMYAWAIRNGFPPTLETQCWNCNCGRVMNNGICPCRDQNA